MKDSYFSSSISDFQFKSSDEILGELARAHHHALEHQQRGAWLAQIEILKHELDQSIEGQIFFEFSIPRMGKRADVVLLHRGIVFVVEFKVGSSNFDNYAIDQAHDYALDLKNFHLGSHEAPIVPVLCATEATPSATPTVRWAPDGVAEPSLVGR